MEILESEKLVHAIVLGYCNFKTTTQKCLESLIVYLNRPDFKLTVIDNGSLDDAAEMQQQFVRSYPQIESIILPHNLGYGGGMNYGASSSNATWIFLIGSDTVFSPDAFKFLCDKLPKLDSCVGIVGPVTNEAGTTQQMTFVNKTSHSIIQEFQEQFGELCMLDVPLYRADFFCVAIRKILWDKLKGLDLVYGRGYYEDFDFCLRAKALGYQIIMLEDVFVYHAGSQSFKYDSTQKKLIKKNKKIFIQKFPDAELRHRRVDQLKTLEYYLSLPDSYIRQNSIKKRIMNRLEMIKKDQPRSFWKKWQWRAKVRAIEHEASKRIEAQISLST